MRVVICQLNHILGLAGNAKVRLGGRVGGQASGWGGIVGAC
jgi:hypothetical protein